MDTVLLVDDNSLRASIRRSALEANGASVVRVPDAAGALCTVESPEIAHALGLVVTGHQMTGISGPEFVAEIRQRMPEARVLVVCPLSGVEREYQGIKGVYFAANPTADELRRLAGELISGFGSRRTA